jgi:DNA-binding NarL/FixJ family response regulator
MSTTLLVADHQEVMRAGLRSLLQRSNIEVGAEANNPKELMRLLKKNEPAAIILDVRFAGEDGFEVLSELKKKYAHIPVLMWSTSDNPTYIARAIALKAEGYLPRGLERAELLSKIKQVVSGGHSWTPEEIEHYTGVPVFPDTITIHFTPREREVIRQLSHGLGNKEIALALGISYETVKEHIQHILRKLKFTDRTEAAVWAVRNNLA